MPQYVVQHKGLGSSNFRLPADMASPGYTFFKESHQAQLDGVAVYVTPQEYGELASGVNASIAKHHYCNSCNTAAMALTLGVCFCPLVYTGMHMEGRVNDDLAAINAAHQLGKRGISLNWEKRTKFHNGGLAFDIASQTPKLQQMSRDGPAATATGTLMMATVPRGSKAGDAILVPTPAGNVQITVPAGMSEGQQFQFQMP